MANTSWPILNLPAWVKPEVDTLAAQLGPEHLDVQFLKEVINARCIDERLMDNLTTFIATAQHAAAAQIAIQLAHECIQAVGVLAASQDQISEQHFLYCGRDRLSDPLPKPCRNRAEALNEAEAILRSPKCPVDIWLRIEGPKGLSWDTNTIKEILATRSALSLD